MEGPIVRNECGIITIFPMYVSCNSINPTSPTASNGKIILYISGGTPPYYIQWENGSLSKVLTNLKAGSYKATVTDSVGDYIITTTCVLGGQTTTTTLPLYDFCLTFKRNT